MVYHIAIVEHLTLVDDLTPIGTPIIAYNVLSASISHTNTINRFSQMNESSSMICGCSSNQQETIMVIEDTIFVMFLSNSRHHGMPVALIIEMAYVDHRSFGHPLMILSLMLCLLVIEPTITLCPILNPTFLLTRSEPILTSANLLRARHLSHRV